MSEEELMRPRYKVIADCPNSEYPVGMIKDNIGESYCRFFDRYPHLFKKLDWWEEREESDMPEYLKVVSGFFKEDYNKVGKVDYYKGRKVLILFDSYGASYRPIEDTVPATKEEYEALQKF